MGSGGGGRGSNTKRRRSIESSLESFDHVEFPILLAACANLHRPQARSLAKRILHDRLLLISRRYNATSPPPVDLLLPSSLLSILPLIILARYSCIAVTGMELVGAFSICDIELNKMISSDKEILKSLVRALQNQSDVVTGAACSAILDLSISSLGQQKLIDVSAVEKLLLLFYQMQADPLSPKLLHNMRKAGNGFQNRQPTKVTLKFLVLDALIVLVNAASMECLGKIPKKVATKCLPLLKDLWYKIRDLSSSNDCCKGKFSSRMKLSGLAATIFRLAIYEEGHEVFHLDDIQSSVFGNTASAFQNFILNHWEDSPVVFKRTLMNVQNENFLFESLINPFNMRTVDSILDLVLQGLVACPPIGSDELDIIAFLNEVNGSLGSPIMYGQDIRVVKTQTMLFECTENQVKEEVHLFRDDAVSQFDYSEFIQKCKEGFQNGYTIALRGIEFRSLKIAAIANGLAKLFGQPSVGANIYVTPPNSQGLSRHYDDHCVFVWQLLGQKRWTVQPRPKGFLPRLYEPLSNSCVVEENKNGSVKVLLEQGDIMYIPRGCHHEAHTGFSGSEVVKANELSFHLTLGIEVEPQFEWEGFVHIALYCWHEKHKGASNHLVDSLSSRQHLMLVHMLHASIRMVAQDDCTFRKACMVAALPLTFDLENCHHADILQKNYKSIFSYLIGRIDSSAIFLEVCQSIENVFQEKNENSFQWMRWIRELYQEDENGFDEDNLTEFFQDIVSYCKKQSVEALSRYTKMKSAFCRHDIYEHACQRFRMLLDKYREIRRQYMNGMLSLHYMEW